MAHRIVGQRGSDRGALKDGRQKRHAEERGDGQTRSTATANCAAFTSALLAVILRASAPQCGRRELAPPHN
jgi:hypothetical protein